LFNYSQLIFHLKGSENLVLKKERSEKFPIKPAYTVGGFSTLLTSHFLFLNNHTAKQSYIFPDLKVGAMDQCYALIFKNVEKNCITRHSCKYTITVFYQGNRISDVI